MSERYVAGMGCRRDCSEDSLRALLQKSLSDNVIPIEHVVAIASIDSKNNEAGLRTLAERFDMSLLFFSRERLLQYADRIALPSMAALNTVGTNVAEASAVAAADMLGGQRAELIIRQCKNADATFALARIVPL